MADVNAIDTDFVERLESTLRADLATAGIDAKVFVERVPGTRLHRVYAISPQFLSLKPSERQDLVWRIFNHHFSRDESLLVTMIWTLHPDDYAMVRISEETAA